MTILFFEVGSGIVGVANRNSRLHPMSSLININDFSISLVDLYLYISHLRSLVCKLWCTVEGKAIDNDLLILMSKMIMNKKTDNPKSIFFYVSIEMRF